MVTILIVDESKLIQQSLKQEFEKNNLFDLAFASNFASAKEILEQEHNIFAAIVGMVLSDAPNGEIVDFTLLKRIPTIVLTGTISDEIVKTYSSKPIIDYVPKTSIYDILYTVEMIEVLYYFNGRKVLIVDDSLTIRFHLELLLKNLLFETVSAGSAEEALIVLADDTSIQLITIDYSLPGMSGIDLIQKINSKYHDRGLSLLAITSEDDSTVISKFIKSGADDLLNKPITREAFNARIFKILSYKKKREEIETYLETMEQYVLTSSTDKDGRIRKLSTSFSQLSGYSKDELIGQPHNTVRHPDMPAEIFSDLWETLHAEKTWEGEIKNRKKDGGFYWVKAHISPLYNSNKKVIGYQSIRQDITDKKEVEQKSQQLEIAKKKITDSIEFSSLIQRAFLPEDEDIALFYPDFFMHWEPKDIVGGDIYQFLIDGDRSLLFMIDCTGHGVPGAFMTMVVKTALETIVTTENFSNPAKILQLLSKTIKKLLKQHNEDSKSDAGLDGGIFFYDKSKDIVKYAGAKTPLFYVQDGELHTFKGDRESIGYKKANENFDFQSFELQIDKQTQFYITTDGYIDQNGGEGGFPYGKKKFQTTILDHYLKPFTEQKEIFIEKLKSFQSDHERDDDITMCGFVLKPSSIKDDDNSGEIFSQNFDTPYDDLMSELEAKMRTYIDGNPLLHSKMEHILTVLYDMGQNILKYAQSLSAVADQGFKPLLCVGNDSEGLFYMTTRNIINHEQKEKIISRIEHINSLDDIALKLYYRELRKSGQYRHGKGAGLGFAELAKRSNHPLHYSFEVIDDLYDYYTLTVNFGEKGK